MVVDGTTLSEGDFGASCPDAIEGTAKRKQAILATDLIGMGSTMEIPTLKVGIRAT